MRGFVRLTGVGLLAALALSACGTSGPSGGEKRVISQADEICLDTQDKVGGNLGDDPEADSDAIREATEAHMAIKAPSQNVNAWTLFVQTENNLWIALNDVYQSMLPEVNDKARADKARALVVDLNTKLQKYATDYNMEECSRGYGRQSRS